MGDKLIEYVVLPGDTLSTIAFKLSGKADDYNTIAAANDIKNPDLIKIGQTLQIPKKFKNPLKKQEIPTNNKVVVIDNYSPNYNYIIEDDKIYYSKKGRDYWVDISDNEVARKNLFNFIGDKYNFRGYEDNEREIWNKLKKGDFSYSNYVENKAKKYNKKTNLEESLIAEEFFQKYKIPKNKLISKKEPPTLPTSTIPTLNANPFIHTAKYYEILKDLKESNKKRREALNKYDADDVWDLGQWFEKGKNWLSRLYGKIFDVEEPVAKLTLPNPVDINSKYAIRPGTYTGDTIKLFKDRRYILPESIDVSEYSFGYRNRGDISPIDTEGGVVTSFSNFLPYGKHVKGGNTYIGVDKNGKLIVGSIDNFTEGSYLAPTYSNIITRFLTDSNGNIIYTPSVKNPGKMQPVAEIIDEKTGKPINKPNSQAINILVNKGDKKGTYGNITGGRYLVKVGDELRLLSGSVENIRDEFEMMKKRNNADRGIFYTLDNGSFNIGLRTVDGKLTSTDLKLYDQRNNGGGNFLYLKLKLIPRNVYKSDTILTPNIRTVNDDSYKKGHSLTNELKGVVLHHTDFMEPNLTSVVNHLRNPKSEASAHVVIGYDGTRKILANPTDVTWHAGASVWNNRDNVNDFMLGIEFLGDTNKKDLTRDQILSAVEYLKPIIKKYNISLENITTHEKVRSLYNDFARKQGYKPAPNKLDINLRNYENIIKELLRLVYYKK